jgi:rare lipoprotein A (peptidoglycan hydrolase)
MQSQQHKRSRNEDFGIACLRDVGFDFIDCGFSPNHAASQTGIASVYGNGDGYAGRKTASGERMNPGAMTAAHRTLPFGTRVSIVNQRTG